MPASDEGQLRLRGSVSLASERGTPGVDTDLTHASTLPCVLLARHHISRLSQTIQGIAETELRLAVLVKPVPEVVP
jgi:hypothetical protein